MGLRKTKANKTRRRILDEALQLFKRVGFEQTTIEAIAEAAEVSPSTLYRYFPNKDLILLDPLFDFDLVAAISRHTMNLPLEEALAEAVSEWAQWQDSHAETILLVRSLYSKAPSARARVWDVLSRSEGILRACLAEKLHLPVDDLQVVLTSRLVIFTITPTVADQWEASAGRSSAVAISKQVMRVFQEHNLLIPREVHR
jgi:AcrR family transcriptional regulator